MALTELFFKKKNMIVNIQLDVIITENATGSIKVTENPVESGANINDHLIVEPLTFTMTGGVANSFNKMKNREVWADLLELQAKKIIFQLKQNLKVYDNIVMLTLTTEQNAQTANALFFTATFKEIIFAGAKVIDDDSFDDQDIADSMLPTISTGLKRALI